MRLTFQGAVLRFGERIRDRLRRLAHKRRAVPTAYHERGYRDGTQLFDQH